jgi:quercetin dioxygenase-like cupin family protein
MVIFKGEDIETGLAKVDWAKNTYVKTLGTTLEDGFNYNMRLFVIGPGGEIPLHIHEKLFHLQYVLEGQIKITIDDKDETAEKGDVIYIPSKSRHKYINIGNTRAVFLCITPLIEDKTELLE